MKMQFGIVKKNIFINSEVKLLKTIRKNQTNNSFKKKSLSRDFLKSL